ncbi:probable cysteine--tRNA ligase, mitochondrial [Lineus longissimus]|uniref:probable cysteine--tRNA ligase, mitochondrial n=1 Tax=Lineus longissimus TaxID=88925 RepID=UPI00315DE30F
MFRVESPCRKCLSLLLARPNLSFRSRHFARTVVIKPEPEHKEIGASPNDVNWKTNARFSKQTERHKHPSEWIKPQGHNTGIKMYNSLTKRKDPFILPKGRIATWYICGPTVYDCAHLGHASCYVRFDVLRRILSGFFNIDVIMTMGVTDIDDKIIARAREMNMDYNMIARQYEAEFSRDMALLKVQPPLAMVRVTEHIPQIISYVQQIVSNGFGYVTESGSVYFDVSKYGRYGKLWTHSMETEIRLTADREKRNPRDFALWKAAKPGEPWWASPWGKGRGRPGWHIECSTMASTMYGPQLDIHSGGDDLRFPHHENELAQTQAYYCCSQWTNYWLHCGHLHLKNDVEKMSKSLKNYISVTDMLEKYTANQFRIFCLLAHYRNRMEYHDESMRKAVSMQRQLAAFLELADAYVRGRLDVKPINEAYLWESLMETKKKFKNAIADDFDTPRAMDIVMELVRRGNIELGRKSKQGDVSVRSPGVIGAMMTYVDSLLDLLGIQFSGRKTLTGTEAEQQLTQVLDSIVSFRRKVRLHALQQGQSAKPLKEVGVVEGADEQVPGADPSVHPSRQSPGIARQERDVLLQACDEIRDDLVIAGIQVKDRQKESSWQMLEDKTLQGKKTSFSSYAPLSKKYGNH